MIDDLVNWVPGQLGTWITGYLDNWVHGHLGTRAPGHLGTRAPGYPGKLPGSPTRTTRDVYYKNLSSYERLTSLCALLFSTGI